MVIDVPTDSLLAKRMRAKGYSEREIDEAHRKVIALGLAVKVSGADPSKTYDEYASFIVGLGLTVDEVTYDDDSPNSDEFNRSYTALVDILAPYGKNAAPRAEADYFVISDNYGTRELLVEVVNESLDWTGAGSAIRRLLPLAAPGWVVILRFPGRPDEVLGTKPEEGA